MNDLKNGNVIRGCCWYGDKKEALDTGLSQNRARKGLKRSPDNKRNAQVVTIITPGGGGAGDKIVRSRNSSQSDEELATPKKLGYELYRRPKELPPYMTFEE